MKKITLLSSVLALSFSANAMAGQYDNTLDKRLYLAPSASFVWSDDDRQTSRNDYGVNLAIGKAINEEFNLELKAFYNSLEHNNSKTAKTQYQWDMVGLTADALYFFNREKLAPYAVVGAGFANSRVHGKNGLGLIGEAGLGVSYRLCERMSLRADARYRYNNNFNNNFTANNADEYNDGIINVGAVIYLGASPSKYVAPVPVAKPMVQKAPVQKIVLKGVNFNINSSTLTTNAKNVLSRVASDLKANSRGKEIEVEGHSSADGNAESNLILSQERAEAVVEYFRSQGVTNTMTAKGYGSEYPISDDLIENRRVELLWK